VKSSINILFKNQIDDIMRNLNVLEIRTLTTYLFVRKKISLLVFITKKDPLLVA